jgi:hypothetical protein
MRSICEDRRVRPPKGELLHFSEDPTIEVFVPHVPATAKGSEPLVWAVDGANAPSYWFPRECPRVCAWSTVATTAEDRERVLGAGGSERIHAIEFAWLRAVLETRLFGYRLPAEEFRPLGEPEPYAWAAPGTVRPLAPPEAVGDLIALHEDAGIELRLVPSLAPLWAVVKSSTVGFSGIGLHNAGIG